MVKYIYDYKRGGNMAGYVIHIAVAQEYLKKHREKYNRDFILGAVIPDLTKDKSKTHYGKSPAYTNLKNFLLSNNLDSELNKGKFIHLITDYLFYNYYLDNFTKAELHNDYDLSNRKIIEKYKDHKGGWCIPYETKHGIKQLYFAKYTNCKKNPISNDKISLIPLFCRINTSSFDSKLKAKVCELCGSTDSEKYEIHHVNKVKNLKGKEPWERVMIAKNRKTLVVCWDCHHKVIHGKK